MKYILVLVEIKWINYVIKIHSYFFFSYYVPSEWFETERIHAAKIVQQSTDVTKGSVSYSSNAETMFWHIPKLSLSSPYRYFFLTGKPLATLSTMLKPPSHVYIREMVKVPAQMRFYTKYSARSSEIEIASMKLDLKLFEKFKSCFTSVHRIQFPISFVIRWRTDCVLQNDIQRLHNPR